MLPTLQTLRYRHPEHVNQSDRWALLDAMVDGGSKMNDNMKRQLLPNPDGRPEAVVRERVKLATYTNKIGPIVTRFNSELFSDSVTFSGSVDEFWAKQFMSGGGLLDGDDDARAAFPSFLRESMFKALKQGKAIAQIDTRIASGEALSREAQSKNGELNPYVILHPRSALWDWQSDSSGFVFCKLQQFKVVRGGWDAPAYGQHDFTIFQRDPSGAVLASRYTLRKKLKQDEQPSIEPLDLDRMKEDEVIIEAVMMPSGSPLENVPIFNYAGVFEFPIVTLTLPPALWIADQLFELQKSYFCQTAGLEYALYSNNYAMPIVTGVDDPDDDPLKHQKMGEGYYMTLKTGQAITSYERSGSSINTAIGYRGEIKRDIYDQLQQIAMSAADGAAIIARSGQSKREDRRPVQILLETFGQILKEYSTQILRVAAIAHAEDVRWTCDGFDDFLGEGVLEEITDLQQLQTVPIPSSTFKRATAKFLVRRVGRSYGLDSDDVTRSLEEIDQAGEEQFQPAPTVPGAAPAPANADS